MRAASLMIAGLACAVTVAACGGSASGGAVGATTESPNSSSSPIGLSNCMRSHGVTNFPDPSNGPGGEGFNGIFVSAPGGALVVDRITFSGPVDQAAEKACSRFLPPSGPPPKPTASQQQAALRVARCMRTHGVPNFPDPAFSSSGGVGGKVQLPVNTSSPAFKQARTACGRGPGHGGG
ncbi:MAG TPA: hypothetical protein VG325_03720 [Solirubrobacteraceae bacterium]|jgi:hypothetical protein|nr:hypothetical protein [Solirubrobacteraceae bacterium]